MVGGLVPYFGIIEEMLPAQVLIQRFVVSVSHSSYLAIPLFITAGVVMNYAGISRRLLDLADAVVGHLPGGLGHVNVLLSVLMGGVSGSAAADAATEAKILVPEMDRRGYGREFSGSVTIASSILTPIIPPGMGNITPPFGIVMYQVRGLLNLDYGKLVKECMPFIIILLIVLAVITYCPRIAMFIPNLIYS